MPNKLITQPRLGLWQPRLHLKDLYYGSGCVGQHLLDTLPGPSSKVFIITSTSLATKTPLVRQLEDKLGQFHAGTISGIGQHGPIVDVERAIEMVLSREDVDTILSLGGGSAIDTAKVISLRSKQKRDLFLTHLTIPTTLSAAECTAGGGYTKADGVKIGFRAPEMGVSVIFYDPQYARYTPKELWLSTGMRAMDHAVECMYHPTSAEVPWKTLSIWAVGELSECLPKARDSHPYNETITIRLMLAAYASSGLKGENLKGVKLKAHESMGSAKQICRLLPAMGGRLTGDDVRDALEVGDRIIALVKSLDLNVSTLSDRGVGKDQRSIIAQRALGGIKEGPMYY
ncbi:putative Maleylacetate reductase [Dothidotthia symphoricarpi CBS 119687]|uniref:Putative Maleylacetate reductase n=1 Tax=Dothidotthia symphoricarpi CBS 119687 TaxID=1392245 RepID=A0A6A5ZWK6_9PLEO|nr:putative Maleylacetate reductase [Dothidotthia symphoricarpi CBS 119687]KAF2123415.1 putative Maleylacetate reductase [Dothidotthia symphoricarpi CBS 119687]